MTLLSFFLKKKKEKEKEQEEIRTEKEKDLLLSSLFLFRIICIFDLALWFVVPIPSIPAETPDISVSLAGERELYSFESNSSASDSISSPHIP